MSTISAIICTYNRERYLGKALDSIRNQSLDKDRYQIIIVNNNSADNTENLCRDFIKANPDLSIIYVNEQEQGLSAARNRGIRESDADYLTFVDDDATLDNAFLEVVTNYLDSNTNVIAVGGKILLDYEETRPGWANVYLDPLFGYFDPGNTSFSFRSPRYPKGSNMSFRSGIFDQIGNFSTELGRKGDSLEGNEEKELFARAYKLDKSIVYLPEAVVFHAVPALRTQTDFIREQAIGFGQSEKIYRRLHGGLARMYTVEAIKWGGSLILFLYYLLSLRPPKGWMILRFRCWVCRGMRMEV